MDEKEIGLKTVSYHYEGINMISWKVEIYAFGEDDDSIDDRDSPFGGELIGKAKLYYYDATRESPYALRMNANIHTRYSQFETLNSVRIFQDEFDYEIWSNEEDKSLNEGILDYTDFSPGELESLKSWNEYDENTIDVYGRLVCLDEIKIFPEYRNKGFGKLAMYQLLQYFEKVGMDFMLLKPFPIEGDSKNDIYRVKQIKKLINFYQKIGFKITKGKLRNEYCMVKRLD